MLTPIIVGVLGLYGLYYLVGLFIPLLRVPRKNNRYSAWGLAGQIWGWVNGDKKGLPFVLLPFCSKIYFTFSFNMSFSEEEWAKIVKAGGKGISAEGKEITYSDPVQMFKNENTSYWIVTATEIVNRIRIRESYRYAVGIVLPISGFTMYLDIEAEIEVHEPSQILRLGDPFIKFGRELKDVLKPWAVRREADLIEEAKKDRITELEDQKIYAIRKMLGLKIDANEITVDLKNEDGTPKETVSLKKYMEEIKGFFTEYTMEIREWSLSVAAGKKVKELLDTIANILIEQKKAEERAIVREVENQDELLRISLDKTRLIDVTIPLLGAIKKVKAAENSGFQGATLMTGNTSSDSKLDLVLASLIPSQKPIKTAGGTP